MQQKNLLFAMQVIPAEAGEFASEVRRFCRYRQEGIAHCLIFNTQLQLHAEKLEHRVFSTQ
jgi:hypothetical protein